MPSDYYTFWVLGAVFVVVGIILYLVGRREEARYYNAISSRFDVKEFITRFPKRPEPMALKIGGRIGVILGVIIAALGTAFWYWG